jgi:hypothetical protein
MHDDENRAKKKKEREAVVLGVRSVPPLEPVHTLRRVYPHPAKASLPGIGRSQRFRVVQAGDWIFPCVIRRREREIRFGSFRTSAPDAATGE